MRRLPRRRLCLWTFIAVGVLLAGAYAWLTHPDRLRRAAQNAIRNLGIEQSSIGEVVFSPWDGLRLTNLVVQPAGSPLYEARARDNLPPFLQIGALALHGTLADVLLGRFGSKAVDLDDVRLTCVCGPGDAPAGTADEGEAAGERLIAALLNSVPERLPELRIRQLDFQLFTLTSAAPQLQQRLLLDGGGERLPNGYRLTLRRRGPSERTFAAAVWDAKPGSLSVQLEPTELRTVLLLVPPRLAHALAEWRLAGTIAVDQLQFERQPAEGPAAPQMRMAGAACTLHLSEGAVPVEKAL